MNQPMKADGRLRLRAEDAEALGFISAALQDAVLKVGDIQYAPGARTLTLALNRYRWEKGGERIRTGLQFGAVLKCQSRNIRRDAPDAVVSLLSIEFSHTREDDPGGCITLHFAGDGDLKIEVECVDAALADLSDPWPTPRTPAHG